jgi:ubiquinone/menaquinone biosynthesis C-methylase UbiE
MRMKDVPSWRTFEQVADVYDDVLPFFTRFGQSIVAAIDPQPGTRMLDIGSGRGALVGPALERGCTVTGIDASPGMVARLRADFPGVDAQVMDAQDLELADDAFDLATAAFVVHLLDGPAACVAEAYRVLAPGGRFAMTDGAAPAQVAPGAIQDAIDALFAEFNKYLPPGGSMGRPVDARETLEQAGFVDLEARHAEVSLPVPDGDALWSWALSHGYRAFIDDLPAEHRDAMRERMREIPGPDAVLQRATSVVIGRKP